MEIPERLSERVLHQGLRFNLTRVIERLAGGTEACREILRHPGAAVILPILADGRVVLVEQYRTTVGGPLLELPAGTLDPGEEPAAAAARELEEETGYRARSLRHLLTFYPAPGVTDERMHLFLATGLESGRQKLDAEESLDVRCLTLDALRDRLLGGEIEDGKTLLALLYVLASGMAAAWAAEEGAAP
ncbi:MAG: NUDIX hydrolase [Planctomycetes bacterium]|nr:NUDIX hydrolase [Planctomycetota bacterium]